jgi:hypothetical protein
LNYAWWGTGADKMVQSGFLYNYAGAGGQWGWTQQGGWLGVYGNVSSGTTVSGNLFEYQISLADLGLSPGQSFTFIFNDSGTGTYYTPAGGLGAPGWAYTLGAGVTSVPEPSSLALLGALFVALGLVRWTPRPY